MVIIKHAVFRSPIKNVEGVAHTNFFNLQHSISFVRRQLTLLENESVFIKSRTKKYQRKDYHITVINLGITETFPRVNPFKCLIYLKPE